MKNGLQTYLNEVFNKTFLNRPLSPNSVKKVGKKRERGPAKKDELTIKEKMEMHY